MSNISSIRRTAEAEAEAILAERRRKQQKGQTVPNANCNKAEAEAQRIEAARAEARRAEEAKRKANEEETKQEVIQLRNKLNDLAGKWEKEGKPMVQAMPQICEEYLKKLESSLTEDKRKCHFWQTPLYKKYDWESIEKCLSLHRKLVELNFDSIKKDISRLNNISKKIIESLEIMESGKDNKSYETQLKSVNDQLKKYESYIHQLVDDGSLVRFFKRMNRLKLEGSIVISGRPEAYFGKDSALNYCLTK